MTKAGNIVLGVAIFVAMVVCIVAAAKGDGATVIRHRLDRSELDLRGQVLLAPGTNPSVGALVTAQVTDWDGQPVTYFSARTDDHGNYSLVIPQGPSRVITVTLANHPIQTVAEFVKAVPRLSVSRPHRGVTVFHGGVKDNVGAPLPVVVLQDLTPSGWRTFGACNPNWISHLWRIRYRSNVRLTLRFRVMTLPNAAFATGYSKQVRATVG